MCLPLRDKASLAATPQKENGGTSTHSLPSSASAPFGQTWPGLPSLQATAQSWEQGAAARGAPGATGRLKRPSEACGGAGMQGAEWVL